MKAKVRFGAREFVSFVHAWGQPEWVVIGVEAPVDEVRTRYAKRRSATQEFRAVPIRVERRKVAEIAPLVAIVKAQESSWSAIYHVLCLPIEEDDIRQAMADARELSLKLKTKAAVFVGEDTSYSMALTVYRNGKEIEKEEWDQAESADKAFGRFGLFLPACYPCNENGKPWLAAASGCLGALERADILNLERVAPKPKGKEAKKLAAAMNRAASAGNVPRLKKLIEAGADVNAWDESAVEGFRPLISAAEKGRLEAVKFLLANGAEVDLAVEPAGGEWDDATALMMACYNGHEKVIVELLKAGADVNVNVKEERFPTTLQCAVEKGRLEIARLLLRAGAKPSRQTIHRAIKWAQWKKDTRLLEELLKGKRPGEIPFTPRSVSHAVADEPWPLEPQQALIRLLLRAGADVNGENGEALKNAMRQRNAALVEFLIESGAEVNPGPRATTTPLHYAAFLDWVEGARLLLQKGARLDAKNAEGRTPAEWAKFHGSKKVAGILKRPA